MKTTMSRTGSRGSLSEMSMVSPFVLYNVNHILMIDLSHRRLPFKVKDNRNKHIKKDKSLSLHA